MNVVLKMVVIGTSPTTTTRGLLIIGSDSYGSEMSYFGKRKVSLLHIDYLEV